MRRSMLFLPGNTPNIIQNGEILGADAVILDLEDAVAPTEKDSARILVRNAIGTLLADISKRGLIDHPGWLLSALVTGKGSELPGGGFYDLAKSLGMLSEGAGKDEKEIFFGKQLEGLWKEYRSRPGVSSPVS